MKELTVVFLNRGTASMETFYAHIACPNGRHELSVRLLDEDSKPGTVVRLLRTLYETRDAAHAWDECFNDVVVQSKVRSRIVFAEFVLQ